jgi:hypothetical protein
VLERLGKQVHLAILSLRKDIHELDGRLAECRNRPATVAEIVADSARQRIEHPDQQIQLASRLVLPQHAEAAGEFAKDIRIGAGFADRSIAGRGQVDSGP